MSSVLRLWAAVAVAAAAVGCVDPQDGRPGLRLGGEVVTTLPSDWSFTNDYKEIAIEIRAPYLLPHSVTIWCGEVDGGLYVAARDPEAKRWPGWVDRNPDVRLRIGDRVYEVRLAPLDDPNRLAPVRRAYAAKYDLPDPPAEGGSPVRYWRVQTRG